MARDTAKIKVSCWCGWGKPAWAPRSTVQEGFDGALDVAKRPPAPLAFSHTATLDQVVKNLSQKSKLKYFFQNRKSRQRLCKEGSRETGSQPCSDQQNWAGGHPPKDQIPLWKITINLKVKKVEPSHWPFSRPERKLMLRVKQIWDSCRCRCWKYFKQTFLVNCPFGWALWISFGF